MTLEEIKNEAYKRFPPPIELNHKAIAGMARLERDRFIEGANWMMDELAQMNDSINELVEKLEEKDKEIAALKAEVEKERWIPVSERLPEEEDADIFYEVQWFTTNIGSVIEKYNYDFAEWEMDNKEVTHWKPINQPQ